MGPKVLVTGSAGDIGTAIVRRLHGEGYAVIGLDKDAPEDEGRYAGFYKVDLRSEGELRGASEERLRVHTPIWSLVYCAGVYPFRRFEDYDLGTWDEVNAVNIRGAFQVIHLLRGAITRGGRVFLIASGAAHVGSRDVGYSASKAVVLGLVRGLYKVLAPRRVGGRPSKATRPQRPAGCNSTVILFSAPGPSRTESPLPAGPPSTYLQVP